MTIIFSKTRIFHLMNQIEKSQILPKSLVRLKFFCSFSFIWRLCFYDMKRVTEFLSKYNPLNPVKKTRAFLKGIEEEMAAVTSLKRESIEELSKILDEKERTSKATADILDESILKARQSLEQAKEQGDEHMRLLDEEIEKMKKELDAELLISQQQFHAMNQELDQKRMADKMYDILEKKVEQTKKD